MIVIHFFSQLFTQASNVVTFLQLQSDISISVSVLIHIRYD